MEPLILVFGMRQVRKMMTFLPEAMNFLVNLNKKYIPFIKPEDAQNDVAIIPKKKKYKMKEIIRRIIVRNHISNVFKKKDVRNKRKRKRKCSKYIYKH